MNKSYRDILLNKINNNEEINKVDEEKNDLLNKDLKPTKLESRLKILEYDYPINLEYKTFEEKLSYYCANGIYYKIAEIPTNKLTKDIVNSQIKFMIYKCNEIDLWITDYMKTNELKDDTLLNEFYLRKYNIKLCIEYMLKLFH